MFILFFFLEKKDSSHVFKTYLRNYQIFQGQSLRKSAYYSSLMLN